MAARPITVHPAAAQSTSSSAAAPPPGSGAVYVFQRSGAAWAQQAYIKSDYRESGDAFGNQVVLFESTLAVGAYGDSSDATGVNPGHRPYGVNGGAAYVFERSGTTWVQKAYIKAAHPYTLDFFGSSLALSSDALAVGAYHEAGSAAGVNGDESDKSSHHVGAVYLFRRSGNSWAPQIYIKPPNPDAYDGFGWSVALSGSTLVAGAPGESSSATGINGNQADNSAASSGAAYSFTLPSR